MEPSGSMLLRKPSVAPPPPPLPPQLGVAGCSAFSLSSSSSSGGEMEELPFSLEDLPPEIRNKIDDIIDKNEDLESQLEAIDELLFADRLFSKFESGTKYDIGSESGIGSDSDSGNSWASSTVFRPPGEDAVIDPRTFGPLPSLRSGPLQPKHDVEYLISRLIVPAPPPPAPLPSKVSVQYEAAQRNLTRFHRSPASNLLSPTVGYQQSSQSKPSTTNGDCVSSTPTGSGAVLGGRDSKDEGGRIAPRTTGDSCLESSLDVPPEFRSTPSPDPTQERISNVLFRTPATKWEGKNNNSGPAASRILKNNNNRISMNVATELSGLLASNTRQKAVTLSRSSSRTELYAWSDVPGLPTPSQSISSEKSVSAADFEAARRSSQPNLQEASRKSKLFLRKDETESSVHSKVLNGSTVDLRRNKWSSVSEFLSKGSAEFTGGRDDFSDDEGSDPEDVRKEASPVEDNFSSLVRLREKSGKPSPMVRLNQRTMKAQSMLSLYDPSSDAKEKSKVKKSSKKETGGASDSSRKRLSTFLQRKLKFTKKSNHDGTATHERTDLTNGVISKAADSEVELHRSDYLSPSISSVPARCSSSIPSPSLYSSSSMDSKNANNQRMRSRSEGPGHISEIFRVYSRDLNVDDDRPRLTFDTFRGQIEPIRWRDEKTSSDETNRRNNASTTTNERSLEPSLALTMSAPNANNVIHLNANNNLHRPNDHLPVQNSRSERFDEKQSTNNREQQSDRNVVKGVPTATLPVIKPAMLPASKPLRSQGNVAGRSVASGASASAQATLANGVSSRTSSANGLEESVDRRRHTPSSSGPQSGFSNVENGHSSGHHQRGNSKHHTTTTSDAAELFSTSNSRANNEKTKSNGNNGNEYRSYSEEQKVLQTSYDDPASACDRAVLDARATLSSLLADRERILSASDPTPGSSTAPYRTRKELLASNCRQLVTDVKLMVTGATRSRPDLIGALTAAMHTFAGVFEACRLTVEVMPTTADGGGRSRRRALLDEVLKLGDVFLDTLSSCSVAAGRGQSDPAMEVLMYHTTQMAHSLGRLLNTIKCLDG